jgi:MoxR-like ATPase
VTLDEVAVLGDSILDEVERVVVGKRDVLELVLIGLLADGHVLIEDFPGLAKTLIARSVAQTTSLRFARIQFTPDLMPADVTGSSIFNQREGDFEFRPGPVFTNLLLGDEINRAPPKTQAALLEAMQERQATIEGVTRPIGRPFIVLATQNPIEYEGTYPLPEAQLDRFLLRISVGYPTPEEEWHMAQRRIERRTDDVHLRSVVDGEQVVAMQEAIEDVHVDDSVGRYMVDLVTATRTSPSVQVGASPRGTLALLKAARCRAALRGRDFVTPDDVKAITPPALAHRLALKPELWVQRVRAEDIVADLLETVPTPAAEDVVSTAE